MDVIRLDSHLSHTLPSRWRDLIVSSAEKGLGTPTKTVVETLEQIACAGPEGFACIASIVPATQQRARDNLIYFWGIAPSGWGKRLFAVPWSDCLNEEQRGETVERIARSIKVHMLRMEEERKLLLMTP